VARYIENLADSEGVWDMLPASRADELLEPTRRSAAVQNCTDRNPKVPPIGHRGWHFPKWHRPRGGGVSSDPPAIPPPALVRAISPRSSHWFPATAVAAAGVHPSRFTPV